MKIWNVVALPPLLVEVLESKKTGSSGLSVAQAQSWGQLLSSLTNLIAEMTRFSSHEALDAEVEVASESLAYLSSRILTEPWTEDFQAACYRLYRAIANYGEKRKQLRACPVVEFDALIHALQAHRRGKTSLSVARQFQAPAVEKMEQLVDLYKTAEDSLPEEIRQALLQGIQLCSDALGLLAGDSVEALDQACANLRDGGTLLNHLQEWKAAAESQSISAIPQVGEQVLMMLHQLETQGQLTDEVLELWTQEWFWALQESWAQARHDFFMPRAKKDKLVGRLDGLMVELRDLIDKPPRLQQEILLSAERSFDEIASSGFDVELFQNHPQAWMADIFLAVLAGGVPRYQIREFQDSLLESEQRHFGELLARFESENDRDYILDALELMERDCEALQFQKLQT